MRIRIIHDPHAESPREGFDLGTFIHWHRRYTLGDRQINETERRALERGGLPLLTRYLQRTHGARVVLPVGLLDHSGLHVYAGRGAHWCDPGGWDSGTVGVIFDTADKRRELGTPEDADSLREQLIAEVEHYDQYLRGDVYGFVIEDGHGKIGPGRTERDSCWGFYGADPNTNGMTEHWDKRARAWWAKHGAGVEVEYSY